MASNKHTQGGGGNEPKETFEWRLDLSEDEVSLPEPGEYPGTIRIKIIEKTDVLWMVVEHRLEQFEAVPKEEIVALQARPGLLYVGRVVEGKRLLIRLCAASGIDSAAVSDPFMIPGLLTGHKVLLTISHKKLDGVTGLVVRGYRALPT